MKILGTVRPDLFLVEVSREEMERLTNDDRFAYRGRFADSRLQQEASGVVIDLDSRWRRLIALEASHAKYLQAVREIRQCADLLEPLASCVNLPKPEQEPDANQTV